MPREANTSTPKPGDRFIETARELGLDNEESRETFERALGKIAPPKKRDGTPGEEEKQTPSKG